MKIIHSKKIFIQVKNGLLPRAMADTANTWLSTRQLPMVKCQPMNMHQVSTNEHIPCQISGAHCCTLPILYIVAQCTMLYLAHCTVYNVHHCMDWWRTQEAKVAGNIRVSTQLLLPAPISNHREQRWHPFEMHKIFLVVQKYTESKRTNKRTNKQNPHYCSSQPSSPTTENGNGPLLKVDNLKNRKPNKRTNQQNKPNNFHTIACRPHLQPQRIFKWRWPLPF